MSGVGRDELRAAVEAARVTGRALALGTLVRRSGSTYRRAGARMVIDADGETAGLVSGGCLEPHIAEVAREVVAGGGARLLHFDMTAPSDGLAGYGLGCKGVLEIFLERIDTKAYASDGLALRVGSNDGSEKRVLTTVFRAPDAYAALLGTWDDGYAGADAARAMIAREAAAVLHTGASATRSVYLERGVVECLFDVVPPRARLVVFGAGPDAVPLVRIAKELGWHVTVIDHRLALARREAFPAADRVILARPEQAAGHLPCGAHVAIVVMTHGYQIDMELLPTVLAHDAAYVGLLGPKRRGDQLLGEISDSFVPTAGQLARFYNPIGLRLGGDDPATIALAIVAEIQGVLSGGADGTHLRRLDGPIHEVSER